MEKEEAIREIKRFMRIIPNDMQEAIMVLVPELSESEDERIRKELLEEIESIIPHEDETDSEGLILPSYHTRIDRYKSYLEKQKDLDKMIVVSPEVWDKAISDAFENGKKDGEKQKEQKLVEINEYEIIKKHITEDVLSSEVNKRLKECGWYVTENPSQWSKEDEENFEWFDKFFRAESVVAGGKDIPQDKYFWFKSLRPQPKQVWTEEDDRICHLIMANLSESARHAITLPMETVNDFNNWLRTLQCMPPVFTDWNEEDQTLLSDALGCVTMVQELKKRGKLKNFHISCSYDELRSWVRSLKSRPRKQPSWKPSEEQIKAVEHAYNSFPNDCPTKSNLRRLSFDLKKLR